MINVRLIRFWSLSIDLGNFETIWISWSGSNVGFSGNFLRTHERNGLRSGMLILPGHLLIELIEQSQNFSYFDHGVLVLIVLMQCLTLNGTEILFASIVFRMIGRNSHNDGCHDGTGLKSQLLFDYNSESKGETVPWGPKHTSDALLRVLLWIDIQCNGFLRRSWMLSTSHPSFHHSETWLTPSNTNAYGIARYNHVALTI